MARSSAPRHPARLSARRRLPDLAAYRLAGLLGDVPAPEGRHEDVVRDERAPEAPEPRAGLEPVQPWTLISVDHELVRCDHGKPAEERRPDAGKERHDREGGDA